DVAPAVDLAGLLSLLDDGADAGRREERGNSRTGGAHPLGEGPLRRDLDLDLTRRHPCVQIFVVADVAADHLLEDAGVKPGRETLAEIAGVVRHQRQILHAALDYAAY